MLLKDRKNMNDKNRRQMAAVTRFVYSNQEEKPPGWGERPSHMQIRGCCFSTLSYKSHNRMSLELGSETEKNCPMSVGPES